MPRPCTCVMPPLGPSCCRSSREAPFSAAIAPECRLHVIRSARGESYHSSLGDKAAATAPGSHPAKSSSAVAGVVRYRTRREGVVRAEAARSPAPRRG